jgi:hypothetical protein
MRLAISLAAAISALTGTGLFLSHRGSPPSPPPSGARVPVIVELFSSEGCSSCPPADEYVSTLDRTQPIDGVAVIALEEHVDYWDHLGWRDPFGSSAFGARQNDYARALPDTRVYTPEIVFDGKRVMPGGDEDAARDMMTASAREPKARVAIARDGDRLTIDVTDVPAGAAGDAPEVWLAITESNLSTKVPAGENAGHTLEHAPVVRRLRSLGSAASGALHTTAPLDADSSWKPLALRAVMFVQRARSRAIIGAAST